MLAHEMESKRFFQIEKGLLKLRIELFCRLHPERVYEEIAKENYPIDEALETCKKYGMNKATSYLYERSGAIKEAIQYRFVDIKKEMQKSDMPKLAELLHEVYEICLKNYENSWHFFIREVLKLLWMEKSDPDCTDELKKCLQRIFFKWSQSLPTNEFMEEITQKFAYLTYREFKVSIRYLLIIQANLRQPLR